jgi:predicted nucleic acid-binding protein
VTVYFLDSSALVKRYIRETGSTWIRSIASPDPVNSIIIARITPVEVMSAVMRRRHNGTTPIRNARAVQLVLNRHVAREYEEIHLSDTVMIRAVELLERHRLRAYDVVQLSSAMEANTTLIERGDSPLFFVSADTRLLDAARAEGLAFDNPNDHP